jgi:hypothetical protein
MSESSFLGVVVISVWSHENTIVARLREYRRLDGPVQELGVVGGGEAIIAKVSSWLRAIERFDADEPT